MSTSASVSEVVGSSSTSTRQSNASARATCTSCTCAADRCSMRDVRRRRGCAAARADPRARARIAALVEPSGSADVISRPAKMLAATERFGKNSRSW